MWHQEKMRLHKGRLPVQPLGYICPRKIFLVCLPRRPHTVFPCSQVLSEKKKLGRTWKVDAYLYSCLHADVSEDRRPLFANVGTEREGQTETLLANFCLTQYLQFPYSTTSFLWPCGLGPNFKNKS